MNNEPNLIVKNYVDESIPVTDSYHGNCKDVIPSFTEKDREYLLEKYSKFPSARKLIESVDSYTDSAILVNANLAIDQTYENVKRHECDISISWGVPVIASYYAMALKANPNMSYDEFYNICQNSLKENTNIFDEKFLDKMIFFFIYPIAHEKV